MPSEQNQIENSTATLIKSVGLDIVLTILTLGFFNLWINYRQMKATNTILNEDKYGFAKWFFLTVITFGFYHIYHEYSMSKDLATALNRESADIDAIQGAVLAFFGLGFVTDAIQQTYINKLAAGNISISSPEIEKNAA